MSESQLKLPRARRWLTGQLTHYQHCMFLHRHAYRYQLFLDSDEIPILRNAAAGLPALLERTFSSYPHAASIAFHRFAFRAGCSPPAAEGTAAAWHQQFNAREKVRACDGEDVRQSQGADSMVP